MLIFKADKFDWKSLINERGVFLVTPPFYVDFQSENPWQMKGGYFQSPLPFMLTFKVKTLDKWKGGIFSHLLNFILDIEVNQFD